MQVAADSGYTKMHAGTRYWFCSKACLEKFEAEPAKYAGAAREQEKPT
jgi:YHS domain-containing protein